MVFPVTFDRTAMAADEIVLTERIGPTVNIIVNRPAKRNAMDVETRIALRSAFDEFESDSSVRVVVLRGAGDGSFIAGGDITKFAEMTMVDSIEYLKNHASGFFDHIAGYPKPVIAAIDGHALGGGLEIALACDIRVGTTTAKFGLPEVNLGIIPSAGGTQRLSAAVGVGVAKELILTGRIIDAAEAHRIGLINRAVDPDELNDVIDDIAGDLASKAPLALQFAKESINLSTANHAAFAFERAAGSVLFGTEDKQEGVEAFLEKRDPNFEGR